jgi:N4-gp56 family major capsid protein
MATIAAVPVAINAMFTRRFLERANYKTSYFVGTKAATIQKHGGTATGLWQRFEHQTVSTTALTALTADTLPTRSGSTISITDVTKAVAKYGDHVILNEESDVFAFNGATAEITDALAAQAGRTFNQVVRNEMEDNATQRRAGGAASDGAISAAVTVGDLNNVVNALDRNVAEPFSGMTTGSANIGTVPILDAYWGITHPDVAYDLAGLTGWTSVEKYAGQVQTQPGEIGTYSRGGKGIRFLSTADSSIEVGSGASGAASDGLRGTSDNADVYNIVVYGKNAVGTIALDQPVGTSIVDADNTSAQANLQLISKPMGSSGVADPLNEQMSIGWKGWAGGKILNANWIRNIRVGATVLT